MWGSSIPGRLTGNWQLGTGNYSRQSHCALLVRLRSLTRTSARRVFLWSEKLPFAGYSIVKECLKLPAVSLPLPALVERQTPRRWRFVVASFSQSLVTHDCVSRFLLSICSCVRTSYSTIRARPMQARPKTLSPTSKAGLPTVARSPRCPRAFMSGGWRIPGSNR